MDHYKQFLKRLLTDTVQAVADCENMGFHHEEEGTVEFLHYLRCTTWAQELTERQRWYDYATTKAGRTKYVKAKPSGHLGDDPS